MSGVRFMAITMAATADQQGNAGDGGTDEGGESDMAGHAADLPEWRSHYRAAESSLEAA
jgi:hypothetical protein